MDKRTKHVTDMTPNVKATMSAQVLLTPLVLPLTPFAPFTFDHSIVFLVNVTMEHEEFNECNYKENGCCTSANNEQSFIVCSNI